MKCALASLAGACPTPDLELDLDDMHVFVDYDVFSPYHPWCCDDPDCRRDHLTASRDRIAREIEALVIDLERHDPYTEAIRDAAAVARGQAPSS